MKASIGRVRPDYIEIVVLDTVNRRGIVQRRPRPENPPVDWGTLLYIAFVLLCVSCIVACVWMMVGGYDPGFIR